MSVSAKSDCVYVWRRGPIVLNLAAILQFVVHLLDANSVEIVLLQQSAGARHVTYQLCTSSIR